MYKCDDCGAVFEDAGYRLERHDELPGCPCERWAVCPDCGSDDFWDAKACLLCGDICAENELTVGVCQLCGGEAVRRFKCYIQSLAPAERAYLNEVYDGKNF